jgi:hypothetical protein
MPQKMPKLCKKQYLVFPTQLRTSEDEYKWFWHQMIYFPGTINIVSTWTYIYINNGFTFHLPAAHIDLLCACWHLEAVKGSSSLSSRRLLISPRITSLHFPCPELTDAPCPRSGDPVPPSPRWRSHSQGPHTLPFQGPTHLVLDPNDTDFLISDCVVTKHVYIHVSICIENSSGMYTIGDQKSVVSQESVYLLICLYLLRSSSKKFHFHFFPV